MAQAQITLKMNPIEFQVFQEAMLQYLAGLGGDDTGTKYRKSYARMMLEGMGVGVIPEVKQNGQLSFDERGRVHRYDDFEDDDEPEEEEAPEAETQAEMEGIAEVASVEEPAAETEVTDAQEVTEAQGEPVEVV